MFFFSISSFNVYYSCMLSLKNKEEEELETLRCKIQKVLKGVLICLINTIITIPENLERKTCVINSLPETVGKRKIYYENSSINTTGFCHHRASLDPAFPTGHLDLEHDHLLPIN